MNLKDEHTSRLWTFIMKGEIMSEYDIIDIAERIANFGWSDYDDFVQNKKAIQGLLDLYNKEKEKNKELKEQLRKANKYIRNEMYIDDNPTICGDEEDTIAELPISLYLYNEGLRELLELLQEGDK